MRWSQSLLLPMLVGVGIIVAGAMAQQSAPPAQPAPATKPATPLKPPTADPAGSKILDEAQAKRYDWIETTLWQQMDVQGLTFQTEGAYLSAPENRLHLKMVVHVGDTAGKLDVISDGTTLWETTQVGDGDRVITKRVHLKDVLDALNKPEMAKEIKDEFLQSQSFYGVTPLLQSIHQRMVVTKKENLAWHGLEVNLLTAEWNHDIAKAITGDGKQPWPPFLPRQCRLFLDAKTRWPHRVEWLGTLPGRTEDAVILQMEFRDPKHELLSPEICKREFSFDPGKEQARDDQTEALKNAFRYRNQQLMAQKGKTPPKK
jgi:hypothetical protein